MSPLSDAVADRPAEPSLFASLVDDAAVFPPGNAPLPEAVRLHRLHRTSGYAACVGPLLVPASAAGDLGALLDGDTLPVGVIGRPGTPGAEVAAAVRRLRSTEGVEVAGVELGWTPELAGDRLRRPARQPRGAAGPRPASPRSPTSLRMPRIPLRGRRSSAPVRPRPGRGRTRPSSRPSCATPSTTTSASS